MITTIIIADDHKVFREGLKTMLQQEKSMCIAGEAGNGIELLELLKMIVPDIILVDISMPKMDGIEAIKKISALYPAIKTIALTMHDEDYVIVDVLEAGAYGYLIKDADKAEIFDAIETVNRGQHYYSRTISFETIKLISSSNFHPYKDSKIPHFTEIDKKIIQCICKQMISKEIAAQLHLSLNTVESYRKQILKKIGAKTSAGIVIYAIQKGLYKI